MSKSVITIEPVHPGEILFEEFLEPMGLSTNRLAKHIEVPANRVPSTINGQRGVTGDTAQRLSRALGTSPDFWLRLQSHYELEWARDNTEFHFGAIEYDVAQ